MMKKVIVVLLALGLLMLCLAGCQKNSAPAADDSAAAAQNESAQQIVLDDYLASVKGQSDEIKGSLEKDALTQTDMNLKAKELSDLWDAALNHLLDEAKKVLDKAELEQLLTEQNTWMAAKEKAVEAAGKEVEGGSLYALVVNSEAAKLTEERVYELRTKLMP